MKPQLASPKDDISTMHYKRSHGKTPIIQDYIFNMSNISPRLGRGIEPVTSHQGVP